MIVLAVDPGTHDTAWVVWDGKKIMESQIMENDVFLGLIRNGYINYELVAVEMIASYGMAVGREVFETCKMIGRIEEIAFSKNIPCRMVYRLAAKLHLCHSPKAKDANVRQALIDRIGHQGTKKNPGPTYGMTSHKWAALAVAVYAHDNLGQQE